MTWLVASCCRKNFDGAFPATLTQSNPQHGSNGLNFLEAFHPPTPRVFVVILDSLDWTIDASDSNSLMKSSN